MFSHIQIGARDLPKMVAFYDAVLGCLGLERIEGEHDSGPPGEGWQRPGKHWPQVFVQLPFNGLPATWGNGMQVSFAADSPQTVRAAWEQGDCHGRFRRRPTRPEAAVLRRLFRGLLPRSGREQAVLCPCAGYA